MFKGQEKPTACVFSGLLFYFKCDFPYVLFVLHHYHKQNGVAMAMLIAFVCHALGSRVVGGVSHSRARRKMTSKSLKTQHIYFSDSNYFVWKRVNTITLTTELRGFEGLTLHCFPRERVGTARDQREGPQEPGGFIYFHFLLRSDFE